MRGSIKRSSYLLLIFCLLFLTHHFSLGNGLETLPTINPAINWHTYLGSQSYDACQAIAVDRQGSICLVGLSQKTWGKPINPHSGDQDAFVAKLNKNGKLLWNTFLGSKTKDEGRGIAVDRSGNIYVVGSSTRTWGHPVHSFSGATRDAFAAKLNPKGELKWHTFLGASTSGDRGMAIAVDKHGNAHVGGFGGAFWDTQPVYPISSGTDGWVAKLNTSGVRQWYTPMGSSKLASIRAITLDLDGNIYVAGWSEGGWFTNPVEHYTGGSDAFVAKLDSRGVQQWHTFMGSEGDDSGMGIALDGKRNVLVSGTSRRPWGDPIDTGFGKNDAFIAKLNPSGGLLWNTFSGLKGEGALGWAVATDSLGNIYASGEYPLMKLNPQGLPLWSVSAIYLIGEGNSIALDPSGNIYVGCRGSELGWGKQPINPYAGGDDAMIMKIDRDIRIVSWNILEYPGGGNTSRDDEFRKILALIEPDILVVQEMQNSKGVNAFLKNVMNAYSRRKYQAADFLNGPDSDNALFYDRSRLKLQSQTQIPTSFRDISEYSLKIKTGQSEGTEFRVFSAQLSEGTSTTHKKQRAEQAATLRNYLDKLPSDSAFLVCGSLNMTSTKEKAYRILTKSRSGSAAVNSGRLFDLVSTKGKWSDKAKFKHVHTESTRKIESESGASGGLDDRYDMILLSNALAQNKQLTYMPGSLFVLGNDGKHLNKAVNDPEHNIFSLEIADAFMRASDHLPVIIDLISLEKPLK